MCSDRVSNSGALARESETLLTTPRGPAINFVELEFQVLQFKFQGNCPIYWLWRRRGSRFYYTWTWGHLGRDLDQICNICKLSFPLCLH